MPDFDYSTFALTTLTEITAISRKRKKFYYTVSEKNRLSIVYDCASRKNKNLKDVRKLPIWI